MDLICNQAQRHNLKFYKQQLLFHYSILMTFEQLEEENIEKLRNQCNEKKKLYDELYNKTPEKLWLDDLKCFDKNYFIF